MKRSTALLNVCALWTLALPASARSLPLIKGGTVQTPDQVVVSVEGISFVRPGEPAPTTVPWQSLDLPKLARLDAAIEQGRQKALLTGEKTLLTPETPSANPYAAFLNQPIKVTFRTKETHQTKLETSSISTALPPISTVPPSPTGVPAANPSVPSAPPSSSAVPATPGATTVGVYPSVPQQIVNNFATKRSETTVDQTRQPLDTTLGGLLELISDVSQSSSGNLLRELREQPHIFTNMLSDLRGLQTRFPADSSLPAMADAIQKLAKNGPVAVDAQNALRRHLATLRSRSRER